MMLLTMMMMRGKMSYQTFEDALARMIKKIDDKVDVFVREFNIVTVLPFWHKSFFTRFEIISRNCFISLFMINYPILNLAT